jgi:hypothetical protein
MPPSTETPRPETTPPVDLSGTSDLFALRGEGAVVAPNMVGHLLFGTRSVDFRYNRAAGPINVANNGSTTLVNPAVADDNSPLPLDRFGFRFNYFDQAQQVTGFGPAVFNAQGVGTAFAQTRNYNVELYTFNLEKTFLNGNASVELRVPFSTGLSSSLNLSAGDITGPAPATAAGTPAFNVVSTPGQTLGNEGTQFGNMTIITKGLFYTSRTLALTGGLALGIPSGDNTTTDIIDYSGSTVQGIATIQRERNIHLDNETWSLSPFVAFLHTPTERLFNQGFVQFDLPLNNSTINYSDVFLRGTAPSIQQIQAQIPGLITFPSLNPPFSYRTGIREQSLMQLDWGTGYWLLKDPSRTWLTGIAPTLELHYTTTMQNASVVTLPGDQFLQIDPTNPRRLIQEQPPRVGNLNNRVDILDMTVASTFILSNRMTVATGVSFPLTGHDDRTFDWEAHFQLNYYFGPGSRR